MTHKELLAKIFEEYATTYEDLCGNVPMSPKALLAVMELHKPADSRGWSICAECPVQNYPCPTIQAIEKEFE